MPSPAHYYNDLDASLTQAWQWLQQGARDRHSPMHTPVVATVTEQGLPEARVMVLREADQAHARLRFHTDVRSDKVRSINNGAPATVLAYDPAEHVQLRLYGTAHIDRDSPAREAAWARTSLYGRRCYLGDIGPGGRAESPTSGLPGHLEGIEPTTDQSAPGLAHFALLWVSILRIEWLFLAHGGHRRAYFELSDNWQGGWLIP